MISRKVKVICKNCGKEEYVTRSRSKRYLTCSVACLSQYNSKRYSQKVTLTCPICGAEYQCKKSHIKHHKTCGKPKCRSAWLSKTRCGKNNSNYFHVEELLRNQGVSSFTFSDEYKTKKLYRHVVKEILGIGSIQKLPKDYVIHHKDANFRNNVPENLVVLPKTAHRLLHTWFGNVTIRALHTGKLDRETFVNMCTENEWNFYKEIIDLNVTHQVVVKQGELLENPEEDNQQPSIYRNIIEGSTTNERVLPDNAEDSNLDTSALPVNDGDDIV